jgi:hypothetical protein
MDIRSDLDSRIESLHGVASAVYTHWAEGLRR